MAKELGKTCIYNFAFVERSGTMKAPVGLLSDRTVLRQQDGGASPRQVRVYQGEHLSIKNGSENK